MLYTYFMKHTPVDCELSRHRSEGYARTGYWIPGCDGKGGWMRPGDSSAAAAVAAAVAHPPKVGV